MQNTISSRQAASILNVNESTIKRWADTNILKCVKTAGGHRKFNLVDIKKHAAEYNLELQVFSSEKKKYDTKELIQKKNFGKLANELEKYLLNEDVIHSYKLLYNLYISNIKPEEIFDFVIKTAMKNIGDRWKEKKLSIEQEHIASNTLISALYQFEKSIVPLKNNLRTVVCAGMEKEAHAIGLLCVKIFLHQRGYDVIYPGVNLPLKSLLNLIDEHKPVLLCLTASYGMKDPTFSSNLKKLRKKSEENNTALIIGGNNIDSEDSSSKLIYCKNISELSSRLKQKKIE